MWPIKMLGVIYNSGFMHLSCSQFLRLYANMQECADNTKIIYLPSSSCDNHLCTQLVEPFPQGFSLQ